MDPVVPEPEALGGPTGTWPGVGSNSSNIKYQQPKPNHCSGGEESTYKFSVYADGNTYNKNKNTYLVPSPIIPWWYGY